MIVIDISMVKDNALQLLNKVEAGNEIIIEHEGKKIAKVIPFVEGSSDRKFGEERGKITISSDFSAPISAPHYQD